jgi:glutamate-1-semialdehyde aminotransferase
MTYLLGGSGYVGQAYKKQLSEKGLQFKNLVRCESSSTDFVIPQQSPGLHPHHNWFLCAAHTEAVIDESLERFERTLKHLDGQRP